MKALFATLRIMRRFSNRFLKEERLMKGLVLLNGLIIFLPIVVIPEAYRIMLQAVEETDTIMLVISMFLFFLAETLDILLDAVITPALDKSIAKIQWKIRRNYLSQALEQPFGNESISEEEVVSGFISPINRASQVLQLIRNGVRIVFATVFVFGFISLMSPYLSILLLMIGITRLLLMYRFMGSLDKKAQEEQNKLNDLTVNFTNLISVIDALRTYNVSDYLEEKLIEDVCLVRSVKNQLASRYASMGFINNAFNEVGNNTLTITSSIPLFGTNGQQDTTAVHNMGSQINPQVFDAIYDWSMLSPSTKAGYDQVEKIIDSGKQIVEAECPDGISSVSLHDAEFSYSSESGDTALLRRISVEFTKGDRVILSGASGSGKSTLLNILAGSFEIQHGEHLINGIPISIWKNRYKLKIALMPQIPILAPVSVADNISLGQKDISMQMIMEAAERVHIHNEIIALSDGYQTVVSTTSDNLSTGQKQRVLIARFLLMKPDLLLFDEPTWALDALNEEEFFELINHIDKDCIIVMSAHKKTDRPGYRHIRIINGTLFEQSAGE